MATVSETLDQIMQLDGAVGACVVDSSSGMMLGASGGSSVSLELAAAGNTEVVRAKRRTLQTLDLADDVEDILITLGRQYHLIRLLSANDALFIYLIIDRAKGNLAMARHVLNTVEKQLEI